MRFGASSVPKSSFSKAIWDRDVAAVESFIASGIDVNSPDHECDSLPLMLAIEQQWVEIVYRLIAAGADVNKGYNCGETPLVNAIDIESDSAWQKHHEIGHESTELTELLLKSGAKPTEEAIEIAERYGNCKALTLLHRYSRKV
jgi:ankyrin repeat protein